MALVRQLGGSLWAIHPSTSAQCLHLKIYVINSRVSSIQLACGAVSGVSWGPCLVP